jgi:hypothetical protein
MTTVEPYELHYGASEAYDAFDRLNWLAELGIDEHGRIIKKNILTNYNKPLKGEFDSSLIKSIRKRNAEIERQRRGGKTKRRLRKKSRRNNKRKSMRKIKSIRRKKVLDRSNNKHLYIK